MNNPQAVQVRLFPGLVFFTIFVTVYVVAMKNKKKKYKIAFTGGGTGGHIYPGLAVIDKIKQISPDNSIEFFWIGRRSGPDKSTIESSSIPFYVIPSGKMRRYLSFRNITDLFGVAAGFVWSFFILLKTRPLLLFSKGGYVCVPPVFAARLLGIPVWIHESDSDPGLATKLTSPSAERIFVTYQDSISCFNPSFFRKITVSGNPVRPQLLDGDIETGRKITGFTGDKPMLLILGGSQGALQINQIVDEILQELLPHCYIVHQRGARDFKPLNIPGYHCAPFFKEELAHLLAAADLVVSRAGAGTLWENGVLRKPAILIPLGLGSSRGDQLRNAELFEKKGAALLLKGEDATGPKLLESIIRLLKSPEERTRMGTSATEICPPDSAEKIALQILRFMEEKHALCPN